MPEPLEAALAEVRSLLLRPDLTRAVAAGRRRGQAPSVVRAELRPVALRAGTRLQIVTSDGARPYTRNVAPGREAAEAVNSLLAEPFGNWHIWTAEQELQLRVTKKGEAQVHRAASAPAEPSPHDRVKEHLLDPGDPLFSVTGGSASKRRQVDAFLRALAATLPDPPPSSLRVVDLGCGNAYLTFAAHRYLSDLGVDVETVGVDVREDQRRRNTELAGRLGFTPGIRFVAGTILDAVPFAATAVPPHPTPAATAVPPHPTPAAPGQASAERAVPEQAARAERTGEAPDLVLALHACDTATDEALARAVRWRATWVLAAPCCHHDVAAQLRRQPTPAPYEMLTRHGILRERFADTLTDGLRAALLRLHGYKVDVVEFVDSTHTPRNLLLRARYTGAPPTPEQRREYADLIDTWRLTPALHRLLADHPN